MADQTDDSDVAIKMVYVFERRLDMQATEMPCLTKHSPATPLSHVCASPLDSSSNSNSKAPNRHTSNCGSEQERRASWQKATATGKGWLGGSLGWRRRQDEMVDGRMNEPGGGKVDRSPFTNHLTKGGQSLCGASTGVCFCLRFGFVTPNPPCAVVHVHLTHKTYAVFIWLLRPLAPLVR